MDPVKLKVVESAVAEAAPPSSLTGDGQLSGEATIEFTIRVHHFSKLFVCRFGKGLREVRYESRWFVLNG